MKRKDSWMNIIEVENWENQILGECQCTNEWMNDLTKWINKLLNRCMNEWMNDWHPPEVEYGEDLTLGEGQHHNPTKLGERDPWGQWSRY